MTMTQKGIIYCRVSSQEQVKGTSLDSQKAACLEYAERQGIKVVEIFVERGESATAVDRTELIKVLEYCRKHQGDIAAFIVWKVDRFARSASDHFALRTQLTKYGVRLYSVTEPITDDPMGRMMETLLAGQAQLENDIRKQRCEGGMQGRIASGIRPWMPPIGYTNSKRRIDRKKTIPDEPDPERFYLVQKGLRTYLTGMYSITALADLLTKWGLRTRTGQPMRKQLVERMLTDKFYAGILVDPWTGKEYRGQHQPMITEEEYAQIQRVKKGFSSHATRPRSVLNPDFPLRGFAACVCSYALTASWKTGGRGHRYPVYSCHKKSCEYCGHSIAKKVIEEKFLAFLEAIAPDERFLKLFEAIVRDVWKNKHTLQIQEQQHHGNKIKRLEARKEQILQMRLEGEITKEDSMRLRDTLTNQITDLRLTANDTRVEELDMEAALSFATDFLRHVAKLWVEVKDIKQKTRLQKVGHNRHFWDMNSLCSLLFRHNA